MNTPSGRRFARAHSLTFRAWLATAALLIATTSAHAQSCPPDIISYWKFDDAMGAVAIDSVDANDGTLVNGPLWVAGRVAGALSFDGANDYVLVPANPNLSPTSSITLEAWIKPSTVSGDRHIISTAGAGPSPFGHDYFFRIDNGNLRFSINNVDLIVNNAIPDSDRWYHVVGTYDQAQGLRQIYVDGNLLGTDAYSAAINTGHTVITIGINGRTITSGRILSPFAGLIDEVAIYNRALSPQEIQQHYQNGLNGVGYCPATLECVGYEAPMNVESVRVRKKRALPLKAQLLDANQTPVTDADLSSFPVLEITFSPASGGDPVDVTNDALAVGLGTQGNQFEFTGQRWQYNLDTSNYTAPGTYTLTMVAGDTYVISPTCVARFSIE